jgi:hypothetical protein
VSRTAAGAVPRREEDQAFSLDQVAGHEGLNTVAATDAHPGWVEESLSTGKHLWLYPTMAIEDLAESETLANLLVEDRDLLGQMPTIWESLRAANYIE